DSIPRAARTSMSAARPRASSSNAVFPTPGSPRMTRALLFDARPASRSALICACSASRPISTGHVSPPDNHRPRRVRRFRRCDRTPLRGERGHPQSPGRRTQMTVAPSTTQADLPRIDGFPVGFYNYYPDVSMNYQMNRFSTGEPSMVDEIRAVAERIHDYPDY